MEEQNLDTEARRSLDHSGAKVTLFCFATALVWLVIGTIFGDIVSYKFHFPDWLQSWGPLSFGRLRPAHLNAMIYGWASLAMLGVSVWLVPRLVHVPLRFPRVALVGAGVWNLALLAGVGLLMAGVTDGLEWLELHRYGIDPWIVLGGGLVGISILATLFKRKINHLYVSAWYVTGAYLWFPMLFVIGNAPFYTGVESAAANWFYGHNALGFWLTAINLGAIYYFIPKVLGRPIFSYQLSLLGFWALAFFYSLNGMHHLVGGPIPSWMIATSIVTSILMVIPVAAVALNHHMTMAGRFQALRYSPTLRFVVLGAIAYTAVSLQGIFTALSEVNRITHFTHWTIAHSHVGVYFFVTFVLFGSMYYIVPRLVGRDWPSGKLIFWHFWLVFSGIIIYVIALSIGGVLQGLALLDPAVPFQKSVEVSLPWLWIRSMSSLLLTLGHFVFVWHFFSILRHAGATRVMPPWHQLRPLVIKPTGGNA